GIIRKEEPPIRALGLGGGVCSSCRGRPLRLPHGRSFRKQEGLQAAPSIRVVLDRFDFGEAFFLEQLLPCLPEQPWIGPTQGRVLVAPPAWQKSKRRRDPHRSGRNLGGDEQSTRS